MTDYFAKTEGEGGHRPGGCNGGPCCKINNPVPSWRWGQASKKSHGWYCQSVKCTKASTTTTTTTTTTTKVLQCGSGKFVPSDGCGQCTTDVPSVAQSPVYCNSVDCEWG